MIPDYLMAAIIDRPGDDTPRLAAADWLDDYAGDLPAPGLARGLAEFIRVQCEMAGGRCVVLPPCRDRIDHECRWCGLWKREAALWGLYKRHWYEPLRNLLPGVPIADADKAVGRVTWTHDIEVVFRRGFVDELRCGFDRWEAIGPRLARLYPITCVDITDMPIFPSGGNRTYYVGGLGRFPREYQGRLESLPTRKAAYDALTAACLEFARNAALEAP